MRVSYNGSVSLHRRTVIWEDNVVTDPVQWVECLPRVVSQLLADGDRTVALQ